MDLEHIGESGWICADPLVAGCRIDTILAPHHAFFCGTRTHHMRNPSEHDKPRSGVKGLLVAFIMKQ